MDFVELIGVLNDMTDQARCLKKQLELVNSEVENRQDELKVEYEKGGDLYLAFRDFEEAMTELGV
jgi:hypothetical protein